MKIMYKRIGNKEIVIAGDMNAAEINENKRNGYFFKKTEKNKHGIRIWRKGEKQ